MKKIYKPILFSTSMVQAILAGRKTQTRRVLKKQPVSESVFVGGVQRDAWMFNSVADPTGWLQHELNPLKVGEILWVRETFIEWPKGEFQYKPLPFGEELGKWKPSIFMPKEATRIFLEVTNVRCEQLVNISCQDCKAEGVSFSRSGNNDVDDLLALESFMALWESINGKDSWQSNPWVWVYEFKKVEKPTLWPQ